MKLLFGILVSSVLIVCVYGHAKLVSPIAFNPNPSKIAPCGGGNILPGPAATWTVGTSQTLAWTVVAGDGVGPIRALVDPLGGTNLFPTTVPPTNTVPAGLDEIILSGQTPSTETAYTFQLTVPSLSCTGPSGCTMVVFSSSSWWACTTINITSARISNTTTTGPPAPTCQNATGLNFCTMINNKTVSVPFGQTVHDLDNAASIAYNSNLANPKVFSTPSAAGCASAYKYLECATIFRRCGTGLIAECDYFTGIYPYGCFCSNTCDQASQLCGLNATHTGLLNCASSQIADYDITCSSCSSLVFNSQTDIIVGGGGGGASTLVVSLSSIFIVMICVLFN